MNDLPQQQLVDLLSIHGISLCDDPARCADLLREQCPSCNREVDVLVQALNQGTVAALRAGTISKHNLAHNLTSQSVVSEQEASWAVDTWAQALNRTHNGPAKPLIEIQGTDTFLAEGLPPSRPDTAGIGLRAGVKTGFLVGSLLGTIGMAVMIRHGNSEVSWIFMVAWLLGGVLLGGVIGRAAGLALGPTQSELAGGIAGAVIGLVGGAIYSPLLGQLIAPTDDRNLDWLRCTFLGSVLGLIIGAGLGIFHRVLLFRRRHRNGRPVSRIEQDLLNEFDTRAGVSSGFWD